MRAYISRRLLLAIPTVFVISVISFSTIRLIPVDTVDLLVAEYSSVSGAAVDRAAIVRLLGIDPDAPLYVQYGRWIGVVPQLDGSFLGLLQGNLGKSLWWKTPVLDDILARFPVTLQLGIMGLVIGQIIALPIGILSALRQDTWSDYIGRSFALLAIAVPPFWLATLLVVFPSIWWGYMPPIAFIRFAEDPVGNLKMLLLPALVLGMAMSGMTMRMTRTMMLEVLRQDYIRTAWAKGLRETLVIIRHALKNALIPVITMVGLWLRVLIGGAVIIEQIFLLPGMGRLILESSLRRDYPVVSGALLVFAVGLVLINLVVDLTYSYLDPRVHYR